MRWLNLPVPTRFQHGLSVGEAARVSVCERLRAAGLEPGGYIHMHPTATLPTKQWPEENFAILADSLFAEFGVPAVFTAGPEEAQALVNTGMRARQRYSYWSDLGLEELFALVESCRLFVGNDSGPTHAAAALGKPIVVVWGSSNRVAWRPWSDDYELVGSDLPCIPCPGYACAVYGRPQCIQDIAVERVLEACRRQLTRRRAG
jgi:ADP-heptose:LPS heptosyltransferase